MLRPPADARSHSRHEKIDVDSQGQRLDNFLIRILKGVPRSHVYRLIRSGQVRVNSGRVRAGYRLKQGDRVRVPPVARNPPVRSPVPGQTLQWLAERILYEDSRILLLDKPAGMAVHGGSGIAFGCIEALRALKPSLHQADLVHRLDRGTSGCLVVSKRRSALRQLHAVLREGGMEKRYLALVRGQWQHGQIDIEQPLSTERRGGERYVRVHPEGKPARTRFAVIEPLGSVATLMEVVIETGRTHQIRVHAAHAGHPIAGDTRYGRRRFNAELSALGLRRLFLHAHAVEFVWPRSEAVCAVSAPLPEALSAVLDTLRRQLRRRGGRNRPHGAHRTAR